MIDKKIAKYPYMRCGDLNYCHMHDVMYQVDNSKLVEYGEDYFNKYINYKNTPISISLNKGRVDLVRKYCNGRSMLDIGIGSGEFIEHMHNENDILAYGYDINPHAIEWLRKKCSYINIYEDCIEWVKGFSFWDSLEHIPDPGEILEKIPEKSFVFVSIPIINNILDIEKSKHYRPNEHLYYFTRRSFVYYMYQYGFICLETSDFEIKAGREDIYTFVFQKHNEVLTDGTCNYK